MKDAQGTILYVGKAKSLRNRVTSYFQKLEHDWIKTTLLVSKVVSFDVILTQTETEALILEATLIKRHKPRFNVRLKDDKSYPYIQVNGTAPFPRLFWTRRVKKDGSRYFGPFPSAWAAKQVLRYLNETFLLRDCSENTFRHRSRPCLLYQIGKCSAPCVGLETEAEYHKKIKNIVKILEGDTLSFEKKIKAKMIECSENEDFERAAHYRDLLKSLEVVTSKQVVSRAGGDWNGDVVSVGRSETIQDSVDAFGVVLQIRGGKLISVKHYELKNADAHDELPNMTYSLLTQHYLNTSGEEDLPPPSEILLEDLPDDFKLLEETLGFKFIALSSSDDKKSEFKKELLDVAKTNVKHAIEQSEKRRSSHGLVALEEVQNKLHLSQLPSRIECFDISTHQGMDSVGSRVVFIEGEPCKDYYRRYKIKTVEGQDDFSMMREVLERRFLKASGDDEFPDLLVVDGGKGQLAQAVAILDELNIQGVQAIGLAKARTTSEFQSQELTRSMERVFIPNRKNPVVLYPNQASYRLLTHLRDEAHRFAIEYHRKLRGKSFRS